MRGKRVGGNPSSSSGGGSGSEAKRPRTIPSRFLVPSTPETAMADLAERGYAWLQGCVPSELCADAARAILADVGERLDGGSAHQEEPYESLKAETATVMGTVRDFVLRHVMNEKLHRTVLVPDSWSDTLYGRVKRRDFHTKWHCDAFNTVFQRQLLKDASGWTTLASANAQRQMEQNQATWNALLENGALPDEAEWSQVPIYTFWVPLRAIRSASESHLRIHEKSHTLPDIHVDFSRNNVLPTRYTYRASNFHGPDFRERGYEVGDVLLFHCFTQHEANAHRQPRSKGTAGDRVSLDGRFFLVDEG